MKHIKITKGRDIKLKGQAAKRLTELPLPQQVAIQPPDFAGCRLKPLLKPGEKVKVGTPIFVDKVCDRRKIVSPVSGEVEEIVRGEKRALLAMVIKADGKQTEATFPITSAEKIAQLSREDVIEQLLRAGVWPCLRQRPFSRVADPAAQPKSLFIQAYHTDPLAPDIDFILEDQEKLFQTGIQILQKCIQGRIFLSCGSKAKSKAILEAQDVQICSFSGPHPAGNISTAIHELDSIQKGEVVWWIQAQDVLRVAELFLNGRFAPEKIVAVTGEGVEHPQYVKTIRGAPLRTLAIYHQPQKMRFLSGSVLRGRDVGSQGYLCFYDAQVTVLPQGGERELLGWILPGWGKYSFTHTFLSSLKGPAGQKNVSLDTDLKGGYRAIVLNHLYDKYVALDIMTYFMIKAVYAEDLDEAERQGILECDEEDFALSTFSCPSKFDVGAVIRRGLDMIEKEG